ncbi:MAG: hypothetical protein QOI61_1409 [Actinomycetota bacterium]
MAEGDAGRLDVDESAEVFGNRVAMLDFDRDDLARLRRLLPHVRLVEHPQVQSAVAISGSSAQGEVQLFPGDADFFERVHIRASTEAEAAQILRDLMRATALRAFEEPDIVLVEANLGVFPCAATLRGHAVGAGDPITWTPDDVVAGSITVEVDGDEHVIGWDEVDVASGWVYIGWIAADREQGRIALASVMVDATWEDDAGDVHSLDGTVDPLAQEIYLEAGALPLVQRLASLVPKGARDAYREAMRAESHHYTAVDPSFAKAAKRLYNLFRVADELEAAAYVRELFDEPSAKLYQVPGLLDAADVALDPTSGIDRDTVLRQLDLVAAAIADVTDGSVEDELIASIDRLRATALADGRDGDDWSTVLADVRTKCSAIVNEFFRERLLGNPHVRGLVDALGASS